MRCMIVVWIAVGAIFCSFSGFAADPVYENSAIVIYPGTVVNPPQIDAANFINDNLFVVNFTTYSSTQPFYETSDTLNYVNNNGGVMMANTGFQFDNYSTATFQRTPSASFFNQGIIYCDSTNNVYDDGTLFSGLSYGQCLVTATNIVNPGIIDVGSGDKIKFVGENVDVSHGILNIEAGASGFGSVSADGTFGANTNGWFPYFDLTATNAQSSYPVFLTLTNSTAFFDFATPAPSNNIIRAVFIQDTSGANVGYNVYFDTAGQGFGSGNVTVEWTGTFTDPATGAVTTNYLYLNNNYLESILTNLFIGADGLPFNFTFTESSSPLLTGSTPAVAGFTNLFSFNTVTNRYAYAAINLLSTGESTNAAHNANHSITNMAGRVEITATKDLDLSYSQIQGMNYMSIEATNQFEGSVGASIVAPFSDISVGVTNGFLTISNLMAAQVPSWGGTVQAWSTRWVEVDASGATNDFRILIVGSQLNPVTAAQVQNLILHGTNSIVISDTFNVMTSFSADAQNLTLTTNGVGVGSQSSDGELNIESPAIFWPSSVPNLRNLTNDGAIRMQNLAQFGGARTNLTVIPGTDPVAATGTISSVSGKTNLVNGNSLTVGASTYKFYTKITNSVANQVKIASTFGGTFSNLLAAINQLSNTGTNTYSTNTTINTQVFATNALANALTVVARTNGTIGDLIVLGKTSTTTNITLSGSTLSGGADAVAAVTNTTVVATEYYNFINNGWLSDNGSTIVADNFVNSGVISNGVGALNLTSASATLTAGAILAGGDIAINASTLIASNVTMSCHALKLSVTNLLTDLDATDTNGNFWTVGVTNGAGGTGFMLSIKPAAGDLLGTTITNYAPVNQKVTNVWAGADRGYSTSGYTNNAALGRLILSTGTNAFISFSGTGSSNAIYVDYLELRDNSTNFDNAQVPSLLFNPNLVIYYAQAMANGFSIAEKLNGLNANHLRWMSNYVGHFSSTYIVYPDGSTNGPFNAALAASTHIDSDGDGTNNAYDTTPFYVSSSVSFSLTLTNTPAAKVALSWNSMKNATNSIYYTTNTPTSSGWQLLTNFVSVNTARLTVLDPLNPTTPRYYKVRVDIAQ